MPPTHSDGSADATPPPSSFEKQTRIVKDLFSIPPPLKTLFDKVPLVTYPPNQLPQRTPKPSKLPSFYVFSTPEDAAAGRPSFNPSCLKWQTFLNIAGIDHKLVSSNNHASPTGSLPFLLPPTTPHDSPPPITTTKLVRYASEHGTKLSEPPGTRYEAYQSLLDHRIRNAWLYTLYLEPSNFTTVAHALYILPTSSSILVRASTAHALRAAAAAELRKHGAVLDAGDLYREAAAAFGALAALLGERPWFGGDEPGLFDAAVFAYTQLLLDARLGWRVRTLAEAVGRWENLVRHRERVGRRYYGGV